MSGTQNNDLPDSDAQIVPVQFTGSSSHDELAIAPASKFKRTAIIAVSIVLFFAVLTVIFVLPRFVQTAPELVTESSEKSLEVDAESEPALPPSKHVEPAQAAAQRRSTQAQLEQILALVAQLEAHNVTVWAAEDFGQAQGTIGSGEKAYREQRYAQAQKYYTAATQMLETIVARVDSVITAAVDDGFLQIESRDSGAAIKAFEFALSIEPDHEPAIKGLGRAKTLDQVLALVNEAQGYEELEDLTAALTRYGEALELDAEAPGASSAISRIKRTQLETEFRRRMSVGFAAFDANKDTAAKTAFESAKKLRPNATEVIEALRQVNSRILVNKISRRLSAAIAFEKQEKWTAAAEQFRAAVTLDNDLDGAALSAKRADARAKLDKQLNSMIGRPHRLGTDAVYKEALAVLARARATPKPGPLLTRQIKSLDRAIVVARTPVSVTLVSDNATEVTLYKIGPLGHFDQHAVSIIPGRYVAVGRRDGFQDVRVEFDVSPEHQRAMITIQCEQKLAFGS